MIREGSSALVVDGYRKQFYECGYVGSELTYRSDGSLFRFIVMSNL